MSSRIAIIDLDGENDDEVIVLAKSVGYFYICRSSSSLFGEIPNEDQLKLLIAELFNLSIEKKHSLNCNYIRSINFNEEFFEKESIRFNQTNINTTNLIHLENILRICQQISIDLSRLFQITINTNEDSSLEKNTLEFNHYLQRENNVIIPNRCEEFLFQFHLYSTISQFEYLHLNDHQWKSFNCLNDSILITLPHCQSRYTINRESSSSNNYTIKYLCYNLQEYLPKRTYLLSLTQNTLLRYFTFFYLYFMQGVPAGFSSTALANYFTAEGEQSSTVGTFVTLSSLPWALQFVWGPLIDRFQSSPMGRRRPWIIASQLCAFIASLGLLLVGDSPRKNFKTLVITLFIHSIFASIQDASVDAQAISTITINERGRINGIMRGGFLIGSSVGAAGLAWILRNRSYLLAALINSLILFLFTLLTIFIKEKSSDQLFLCQKRQLKERRKYQATNNYSIIKLFQELFKGLLSKQSLRLFIPILIVYSSQSIFIRAYNIHLIKVLGWSDTSVSILSGTWGTLIVLFVVLIGGYLADRCGARFLLVIVISIHVCYMLIVNLIEPFWFQRSIATIILILWNMMDPILSAASMPLLMSLCRKHVEGSQFTTYMSLVNLCDLLGAFLSGHLQSYFRANLIGISCAICIIIALIIVILSIWYDRKDSNRI